MELFHQRIENATRLIKSFKDDQERLILRSQNSNRGAYKLAKANIFNKSGLNEGSTISLLNTDCIIMPYCQESSSYKKLWPQALIVNRSDNCAEVGQIESHGSLWKIVPCNDSAPGSRVMLQTSERGELPRYLGPDLDIVELKVDAAVWNMRAVSSEGAGETTPPFDEDGTKGLIVNFELIVDAAAGRLAGNPAAAQAAGAQLLVCETSKELRSYSELFVDYYAADLAAAHLNSEAEQTERERQGQGQGEEGVHPTYRSWQWEVFPESLMAAELDFLEGFIH